MPILIDQMTLETRLEQAEDFQKEAARHFDCRKGPDGRLQASLKKGVTVTGRDAGGRYWDYALAGLDADGLAGWLIRAEMKNRLNKYRRHRKERPDAVRVVAEGDSWFQHPLVDDLIDVLQRDPGFAVLSLASAGATLADMMQPKAYLQAIEEERPSTFLLSAGGNDFFGRIDSVLLPWKPKPGAGSTRYTARDYIGPRFDALLAELERDLRIVIAEVSSCRSVKRVLLHGYDYVIPNAADDDRSGHWVGQPMRALKITAEYLQREIVIEMVDRYCQLLQSLAAEHPKVRFVDFRGTLTRDFHWFDEIHPHGRHVGKLAGKLVAAIRAP